MLILGATIYGVFHGRDTRELWEDLAQCRTEWLFCAAGCVLLFLLSAAASVWFMLRARGQELGLGKCFLSACVDFFFSAVTPSATGGQPMQIYYLRKQGVPVSVTTVSILIMSIGYKLTLIVTGLVLTVLSPGIIGASLGKLSFLYWAGLILFTGWCVFLLLLVFHPRMARSIAVWIMTVLEELRILKNRAERQASMEVAMDMYSETADYLRSHPLLMAEMGAAAVVRRLSLLSVTWCVYRGLGLTGAGWGRIVLLQIIVSICADMLPLPGGMGVSEAVFLRAFGPVFGDLVLPGMVLSRGLGHYGQLIFCAAFTLVALFTVDRRRQTEG